jgi:hypothetical protein
MVVVKLRDRRLNLLLDVSRQGVYLQGRSSYLA